MNIYGIIILAALVGQYLLELVATLLNLRALDPEVPPEFQDIHEPDRYRRSQEYTAAHARLGLLESTFGLALVLGFWFAGGFQWLDLLLRGWDLHVLWTGLLYIGLLVIARTVLFLPFRIYATFWLEERFGFNRTTPGTFITDIGKGLLLGVLLGGPLLAGILALFQYLGSTAWLWCWLLTTCFSLVLQYIAPTWIMPLFNRFTPLEDESLLAAILALARRAGFPVQKVFVVDGSRRSSKANAFFTGFGSNRRIALFDTLVENHPTEEIVAVLGHEIGHYRLRHVPLRLVLTILQMGVTFYLMGFFLREEALFAAFQVEQVSVYVGLILFGMLYTPIELFLSLLSHMVERRHEYQADRFAVQHSDDPLALVAALKRLSVDSLSNLTPHPFYVFLHHSHPPVLQRVRTMRQLAEAAA